MSTIERKRLERGTKFADKDAVAKRVPPHSAAPLTFATASQNDPQTTGSQLCIGEIC